VPATLILGMSHTACIRRAVADDMAGRVEVINLFGDQEKMHQGTLLPRKDRLSVRKPEIIAFLLGGNGHNILGLIEHPTAFAVIGANGQDAEFDGRQIVPATTLRAVLAERLARFAHIPASLHEMFPDARLVIVNPPPPLGDHAAILANPRIFADDIHRGLAPDALRIAVHQVQTGIYRDLARRLGADFLTTPDRALTPEGLLAPKFCGNDPTHGNTAFGRLMLNLILDVRNRPPCPDQPQDTPIRDFPIDSSGAPIPASRIRQLLTRFLGRLSASRRLTG
jgi:hypothetical protein